MPLKYTSSSKKVAKKGNKKSQLFSTEATESFINSGESYNYKQKGKFYPKA